MSIAVDNSSRSTFYAPAAPTTPPTSRPSTMDPIERHASIAESSTTSTSSPTSEPSSHRPNLSPTQATKPSHPPDRITVPSACVACRSKHLKCDGLNPCSRCSANEFECIYVRSRRGFKGPRRNTAQQKVAAAAGLAAPMRSSTAPSCPMVRPLGSSGMILTSQSSSGLVTPPDQRLAYPPTPPFDFNAQIVRTGDLPVSAGDVRSRCIEAFYYNFFAAHPFVLPHASLVRVLKERSLSHLEAAIVYAGSTFVESAPTAAFGLEAESSLYALDCPKDGFRVQGLLIVALVLDGYTYQDKALQILNDAIGLAIELGMNKREFALMQGNEWPTLEESWRRTWWELFMVDGLIAGVHQKSMFPLKDVPADVGLPCEEAEYLAGHIPPPRSLEDFDDSDFDERDFVFSSFAYRIAAIRNLGRYLKARQAMIPDDPIVDRIDAHLVNWRLHLPASKENLISNDGILDEMLFQANMITNATTIVLHRELSELDSTIARPITSCAPHRSITPGSTFNSHASKTIQAAQTISKLVTLPLPPTKHTHFFTCVITLSSIVHLSVWSAMISLIHDEDLKQQLRLNIGGLREMGRVWPSAEKAFGQVRGVAGEIWRSKKERLLAMGVGMGRQQQGQGQWGDGGQLWSEEEVLRQIMGDQVYLEELNLL